MERALHSYQLCQIYHCTPDQLKNVPLKDAYEHLIIHSEKQRQEQEYKTQVLQLLAGRKLR